MANLYSSGLTNGRLRGDNTALNPKHVLPRVKLGSFTRVDICMYLYGGSGYLLGRFCTAELRPGMC